MDDIAAGDYSPGEFWTMLNARVQGNMKPSRRIIIFLGVLLAGMSLLAGCSFQNLLLKTGVAPDLTPIYQTISSSMTKSSSGAASTTGTPLPTQVGQTENSTTQAAAQVTIAGMSDLPCNMASLGIPFGLGVADDTHFYPGDTFTQTWRLVNHGSCTWTRDYMLVWFSGDPLGNVKRVSLYREVPPGASIDMTVEMTAPAEPRFYQSNWKISAPDGTLFGIGPQGDAPFWVRIIIDPRATETPLPTATPLPTPVVLIEGTNNITVGESINLDSGELNQGEQDDLLLEGASESLNFKTINNTRVKLTGTEEPSLQFCQNLVFSSEATGTDMLVEGMYYCYCTSQGMPGFLRVVRFGMNRQTLDLDFRTWAVP